MKRSLLGMAAAGALLFAACGSDSNSSSSTEAPAASEAPAATEAPAGSEAPATEAPAGVRGACRHRRGHQHPEVRRVRHGHRPEGHRRAHQARRHRHQRPRHRLHVDHRHDEGLLRLRQRQRRHQRPPDRLHRRGGAGRPAADRLAGHEAGRRGQGAGPRRQHQRHRLQRQQRLLQGAGPVPHHRRRRPGLLHQPGLLGRQHGPVLLEPRGRPGRAAGRGQGEDGRRLAQPARLRRHQQRRGRLRQGERHGRRQHPRRRADQRSRRPRPAARPGGR